MEGLGAWLSEHWPEALSALAATATLAVVLWDRWRPREVPTDASVNVQWDAGYKAYLVRLMVQRPAFGFIEIDEISVHGMRVAERLTTGGYDPEILPPSNPARSYRPGWTVDMHGQHQSALFWFWAVPSSKAPGTKSRVRSISPQNVLRVRLSITLKAARTLKSRITITSNRIA